MILRMPEFSPGHFNGQVKIPVYDEDVERIKELMGYYKFTTKQTTQQKNHLESLESKNGDSFAIRELKKSIKASKVKEQGIIDQIQMIIDANAKYKNDYENIISIVGIGQVGAISSFASLFKIPGGQSKTDHISNGTQSRL